MRNKILYSLFLILLLVGSAGITDLGAADEAEQLEDLLIGHTEDAVVMVYDDDGNYIFGTAMGVSKGDSYIDENNHKYLIEEVEGKRARARDLGKINLLEGVAAEVSLLQPLAAGGSKRVGLYFTHNGESYLPGPDNVEGRGEIHLVGDTLKKALERNGIEVIESANIHLPHDGAAYERSRATAVDLMKNRPDAIFDVHRDAIPRREEYVKQVEGENMSQIRLVVGRQNPNMKVNDSFARQLKAVSDNHFPGLIKGIFYGRGAYNQEISPHALLFELGTHVTTKEEAQASTALLADSINDLLYGGGSAARRQAAGESRSALTTIAWMVGVLIAAIMVYLFINEGSWEGVKRRLRGFFSREILDRGDK